MLLKTTLILTLFTSILIMFCNLKQQDIKGKKEETNLKDSITQLQNQERDLYLEVKGDSWRTENGHNYFSLLTTLTNSTSDTVTYVTFSCGWNMPYTTDNKKLPLKVIDCDSNVPIAVRILPYSSEIQKKLEIMTQKSRKELEGMKFKVGFNFISVHKERTFMKELNNFLMIQI